MKSRPSQVAQSVNGLQVSASNLGQAIPYVFGHCRIPHKLIYWSNFQSQTTKSGGKGGGKGKSGGGQTTYTVNADTLFGYGPFEGIASVWNNQTWFYVNYGHQDFTGSGTATSFSFTVTPATTMILVMGVALGVSPSGSAVDYVGYGLTRSFSLGAADLLPLYNNLYPAPNQGVWANAGQPYAEYNATLGDTGVTVHFPSSVTNPSIRVYYACMGGSDAPPSSSSTGKKAGGGAPIQVPGLTFEQVLGSAGTGNGAYPEFSGAGGVNIPLGPTPVLPAFNYEVKGLFGLGNVSPISSFSGGVYVPGVSSGDCNPADILADLITSGNWTGGGLWNHGLGFSSIPVTLTSYSRYGSILADEPTLYAGGGGQYGLSKLRAYCMARGIFISGGFDSQQPAAELFDDLCKVGNCAPVWDGASLDFFPYEEASCFGNGTIYTPITASGPVADLTDSDVMMEESSGPDEFDRDRAPNNFNSLEITFKDATAQFNDNSVMVSDSLGITEQGPMPGPQESYPYITNADVARSVAMARLRRNLIIEGKPVKFTLPGRWASILTPMDLITISDPTLGPGPIPVRLTKISIDSEWKLACEAEKFLYGASSPIPAVTSGSVTGMSGAGNGSKVPGNVNTPIIFETIPQLNSTGPQLWFCISDSDLAYGGAMVYMSKDGGSTYDPIGSVAGNQTMGLVYSSNYPSHADPDNTNDLHVDLTESLGDLVSFGATQQDQFQSLCWMEGGGTVVVNGITLTIPYELVAYGTATLAATNKYTLAHPNRRGVYGTPVAAHNIGTKFSFLRDGGVFQWNLPSNLIGITLHFKFAAMNNLGGNQEALSDCTDYTFTPSGLVGWTYGGTGSATGTLTITGLQNTPQKTYTFTPATDGTTTTFTVVTGTLLSDFLLFLNGIQQTPPTNYTRSGNTITFTTAPKTGDIIEAVF